MFRQNAANGNYRPSTYIFDNYILNTRASFGEPRDI